MPRELVAVAPRTPVLLEYEEPPLGERQIRVRTEFASPKHGTELVGYRDEPSAQRAYDPAWGAVLPLTEAQKQGRFPMPLGNMAVGVVTDIGSGVRRFKAGDRVFGHFPIRETLTVEETRVDPLPEGLTPEAAVCLDPAVMAMAMRDAGIKPGDRVAVFGLGAIGLMAVQIARIAGADWVVAVDPITERRDLAVTFGADDALDPRAGDGDAGLAIRRLTRSEEREPAPIGEKGARNEDDDATSLPVPRSSVLGGYWEKPSQVGDLGVDVAIEVSGSSQALHQAIRATQFGGTICVLSYYGGEAAGLRLGEEFHVNRLRLVSARAESLPSRDAPGWTLERLVEVTLHWLTSGRLRADGIVTPIVPFAESVEAYRAIDEHPERSIKLGVLF